MMSPKIKSKATGVFWLITIVMGAYTMFVRARMFPADDAAVTAANLLAHETFVRSGAAAHLIGTCSYVVVTLFVYELLKPVDRSLSLLAAFFSLIGCAVGALAGLFDLAPFVALQGSQFSHAFNAEQWQALALLLVRLHGQANNLGLVFFGFHCFLIGWLLLKSAFLPRFVGVLMVVAGLGWLTFLFPPLAIQLAPYNLLPGFLGEGSLTLWLLAGQWRSEARA